jgi:hypothetical protein
LTFIGIYGVISQKIELFKTNVNGRQEGRKQKYERGRGKKDRDETGILT